ncbi:MAG: putative toxin-antitoxin system toxin component, PIN family [Bdellovibrio sp.]|nr:MAG: putative toxin-antitoxin system toxin component, PIN family [Bdellovibrio sp.]
MLKVCLDTNVWLSGIAYSGPPAEVVTMAMGRKFQIVTSSFILDEMERNLVTKFGVHFKKAKALRFRIAQIADVYDPKGTVRVIKDHFADNLVLETAWIGRARYLVTGDKQHLLPLKIFRHVKILSSAEFLAELGR